MSLTNCANKSSVDEWESKEVATDASAKGMFPRREAYLEGHLYSPEEVHMCTW